MLMLVTIKCGLLLVRASYLLRTCSYALLCLKNKIMIENSGLASRAPASDTIHHTPNEKAKQQKKHKSSTETTAHVHRSLAGFVLQYVQYTKSTTKQGRVGEYFREIGRERQRQPTHPLSTIIVIVIFSKQC